MQAHYLAEARAYLEARTRRDLTGFEEFRRYFEEGSDNAGAAGQPGFVVAKWCGDAACEDRARDLGVTIRCIPFEQDGSPGTCVICAGAATIDAVFARAY
jgi:prolyl-tRNA synthetase